MAPRTPPTIAPVGMPLWLSLSEEVVTVDVFVDPAPVLV